MTEIMMSIISKFDASSGQVIGYAKGAFAVCMVLDFVWTVLSDLEQDFFKLLMRRCLYYGIYSFCLDNSIDWASQIKESFIIIGQTVGGGGSSNLNDPSAIMQDAMQGLSNGWDNMCNEFSISVGIGAALKQVALNVFGLIFLTLIFLCYLFIALNIVVQNVLWSLIVPLMIPLLGFGVMQKTSFLAQTAISSILSLSARFAVLAAIMGVCSSFLSGYQPIDINAKNVMVLFLEQLMKVGTVAVLVWLGPSMAAGFFAGSAPTLATTGGVAGAAGSAAGAGMSAAKAAATGGMVGAKNSMSDAKSAFNKGSGVGAIFAAAGTVAKGAAKGAGTSMQAQALRGTGLAQANRDLSGESNEKKKYNNPRGK